MSESAARITLSAKGLIMKIVGDILIIETSDPDELPRVLGRGLEPDFRVLFSAIFHVVSLRNFHQGRNLWKWAEAKVVLPG
jgi:hypothetical protein